jgi:hypothetical protein
MSSKYCNSPIHSSALKYRCFTFSANGIQVWRTCPTPLGHEYNHVVEYDSTGRIISAAATSKDPTYPRDVADSTYLVLIPSASKICTPLVTGDLDAQ